MFMFDMPLNKQLLPHTTVPSYWSQKQYSAVYCQTTQSYDLDIQDHEEEIDQLFDLKCEFGFMHIIMHSIW